MPFLSGLSNTGKGANKFRRPIFVELLLAAGGGSGGAGTGGGGGAGGLIHITQYEMFKGQYTLSIGAGGTNDDIATGTDGVNTSLSNGVRTLTALGGGHGAASETGGATYAVGNGGSGGGAQGYYTGNNTAGTATQPANTSDGVDTFNGTGYGNNGGGRSGQQSGGGGGAGAVGNTPGNGGAGYQSSITGTSEYYAAGGGGAQGGTTAVNGIGGRHVAPNGTNGVANTGSGGGGGWDHAGGTGGNGGSGVAILRFSYGNPTISAGLVYTETTVSGDTVLEFTGGTGTITW